MTLRAAVLMLFLLGLVLPAVVLAAGPVFWDWPADRSFAELDLDGTALDRDGFLVSGLTAQTVGPAGPEIFWRIVPDGRGGYYTGTGHGGEVHHTTAGGQSKLFARLEATEIFSLMLLPDGDLLAGCGPEGRLYRIDSEGQARVVGTVAGGYIWAMARAEDSNSIWLATGSPAGLYRYEVGSGDFSEELDLAAENTLAVHVADDGALLLATQGPGLVYRYEPGKTAQVLYETPQDEARQFLRGPQGVVYLLALNTAAEKLSGLEGRNGSVSSAAALMPMLGLEPAAGVAAAALYRLGEDGTVDLWWSGSEELMTVAWTPHWGWLAGGQLSADGGQARLYSLTPARGSRVLAHWAGGDVLDLLVSAENEDEILVAQAHPGGVTVLSAKNSDALLALSAPLDGGGPVQWGRLRWQGVGLLSGVKWSVRGGNRSEPDESWTEWSRAWTDQDHGVDLPPLRFLQWRVEFPAGDNRAERGRVTQVSVSAWQKNLAPVIVDFQLEFLKDVYLGGMLQGSDNITQRFRSGLQAEFSKNLQPDQWAGPARASLGRSVRVFTWQGTDPNHDRVTYRLEYQREGEDHWRSVSTHRPGVFETSETLASWDTSEVADGFYKMRLSASDQLDNPAHLVLDAQRVLGSVLVDNTPPELAPLEVRLTPTGFRIQIKAEDKTSVLAGARLILPDGSAERLDPVDLICDSHGEQFTAEVVWPREGTPAGTKPWQVRVEVRDLAGNMASEAGEVR